jgi:hypothetical protein
VYLPVHAASDFVIEMVSASVGAATTGAFLGRVDEQQPNPVRRDTDIANQPLPKGVADLIGTGGF